ncbi:hypothetical protein [Pseudomonas sp. N040]|uniref:hypothetical protein n=1 Tax=Pseudomonas sp. N040 TaxID=2785325 RepID=UPI0018A2EDA2|nr:hypothetical protein [Pseudomonas sp. N040]MBF7728605.1 hypothetical protein [Pseudomonas sp. N040]MBW7012245.1 hypothetical protein [Pseudomonas sp. N040]
MAAFVESGMFLKFGSKPRGKIRAVLWPVLVHRVLYPDIKRTSLNLLQRAVLGLIRAKTVRADDLASLTGLHLNLIKLILAQGVSNGWLVDNADELTPNGNKLLNDEDFDEANMKSGYLLQDALTGRFWPRFVVQLSQMEPIDQLARFPEFVEERKKGKKISPFMLAAKRTTLPELDHESLMLVYRDYREDYRASQQLGQSAHLPEQISLQGVQRLDASTQPARVLVWVSADEDGLGLWSVKDPFEFRGNAWWLQETLMQAIEDHPHLLAHLESLVSIPRIDNQSVEQWLEALHKQTELQVLIEYPWVERQPDIKRHLAALLVRREKLLQGDTSPQELDAALVESQKLLEVLMQWLIRAYPADVGLLPSQQRADYRLNQRILNALQIPALTVGVISLLARQKLDQVIRACSKPVSSLKALLFAAVMGTFNEPGHPFKVMGPAELQLEKLLDLADLRNQSSHAQSSFTGKEQTQLTERMALDSIQFALSFTAQFKEWM